VVVVVALHFWIAPAVLLSIVGIFSVFKVNIIIIIIYTPFDRHGMTNQPTTAHCLAPPDSYSSLLDSTVVTAPEVTHSLACFFIFFLNNMYYEVVQRTVCMHL
jgi:hypothetical protein